MTPTIEYSYRQKEKGKRSAWLIVSPNSHIRRFKKCSKLLLRIHISILKQRHFIIPGVSFCEYWYEPGNNISLHTRFNRDDITLESSSEYQNLVLIQWSRLKSYGAKDQFSNVNSTSGLMKANCWRMSSWDNCLSLTENAWGYKPQQTKH